MKTVGIVGLGLIGGSLAISLKHKDAMVNIIAYDRLEEPLLKAMEDGSIDHYTKKINENFTACDTVFICVPAAEAAEVMEQLRRYVKRGATVSDVCSVKADICGMARKYKDEFTFIGGHPMAGSEEAGYGAARRYLFENAYYLLTPYEDTPEDRLTELTGLVRKTGAIPLVLSPEAHDFMVGAISHVPHVVAMALVNAVSKCCGSNDMVLSLASGGFKDITRIASSSPKMWNDISIKNKDNIFKILEQFKEIISVYEDMLASGSQDGISALFQEAKSYRDSFSSAGRHSGTHTVRADIEDRPGALSLITTAFAFNSINIKNIGIANNRDFDGGILEIMVENSGDVDRAAEVLRSNGFQVYG